MFDLFQKEIVLKNGKEGKVIGMSQDDLKKPIYYLVEHWTSDKKEQNWFYVEDFKLKEKE